MPLGEAGKVERGIPVPLPSWQSQCLENSSVNHGCVIAFVLNFLIASFRGP